MFRNRLKTIVWLTVAVILASACASGGATNATSGTPKLDRFTMDTAEFRVANFTTIYDAVRAKHPEWLTANTGTRSLSVVPTNAEPSVAVYVSGQGTRPFPVLYLKELTPRDVQFLRRLSPSESLNQYGWPYGAIVVTTGNR